VGTDTLAALPIPQLAGGQTYTWSFPICPHTVRINLAVVGALQYHVSTTTAPQQGLLLGRRRDGVTHIEAYRPLPVLDERTVAESIEQLHRPVVGCYRIREGCAFIFEAAEIDLCKSAFPELGSVFLLVERRAEGPAEGTFAFWRPDAFVCNLPSPFAIDPEILARTPQPADPAEQAGASAKLLRFLRRNAAIFGFLAAALVLVLILPVLWTQFPIEGNATTLIPAPEPVPVAAKMQGNVRVEWEPRAIAGAKGGLLRIIDGRLQRHVPLTAVELSRGMYLYAGGAGPITFEMRAMGADGGVFDVPTSAHSTATPPAPAPNLAVAATEPVSAPPQVAAPPTRDNRTPAPPAPVAVERKPPAKPFTPVAAARRTQPHIPVLDEAPPVQPMQGLTPALTASLPAAAPPPAPVERHAPAPPARSVKGAGRLIWTGTLERRGVLELDQRSVSIGSLVGALPGVPVNVTVSPAEFGLGGLMVYTTDPKLDKHVEPPSAGNGWNRLTYILDPERVKQIAVLESPNASNRFSHLALRSDGRRCSMLVIDWATQ
jgi:hypothetical protein